MNPRLAYDNLTSGAGVSKTMVTGVIGNLCDITVPEGLEKERVNLQQEVTGKMAELKANAEFKAKYASDLPMKNSPPSSKSYAAILIRKIISLVQAR